MAENEAPERLWLPDGFAPRTDGYWWAANHMASEKDIEYRRVRADLAAPDAARKALETIVTLSIIAGETQTDENVLREINKVAGDALKSLKKLPISDAVRQAREQVSAIKSKYLAQGKKTQRPQIVNGILVSVFNDIDAALRAEGEKGR